jgi:hypothetical protein
MSFIFICLFLADFGLDASDSITGYSIKSGSVNSSARIITEDSRMSFVAMNFERIAVYIIAVIFALIIARLFCKNKHLICQRFKKRFGIKK